MTDSVSKFIPKLGLNLAKYSGDELIERIGEDVIRNVVASILSGGNVRSLTEGLTQRRISLSHAAMLVTFFAASKNIKKFSENLFPTVSNELKSKKLSSEQKIFLKWLIGLTGKSVQNVLRNDEEQIESYLKELDTALKNAVDQSNTEFGVLEGSFLLDKERYSVNWLSLLQLFTAIGTQTLALRGSEKSMYGKLFEKLILGSLLTILGFIKIDPNTSTKSKKVFWLSQRETKRESDATILFKPGVGVRFDIGFIGPGNTEISLDKVSRFEREMDYGRQLHYMSTIVLVDRIGEGSRITSLAKNIDGIIVQMSMNYWVKEVCQVLKEKIGFEHKLLKMNNEEGLQYIKTEMKKIDLNSFIQSDY
jgi:hypothetical protein